MANLRIIFGRGGGGSAFDAEPTGSDFRPVTDKHACDDAYSHRGGFGTYQSAEEDFPTPAGVKRECGWGATPADLERGFIKPHISQDPAYEASNYYGRSSVPSLFDDDENNAADRVQSQNFRNKNRVSKGFLERNRYSRDR